MYIKEEKFGDNLKILRSRLGISQEKMSELLHVTRQTISTWEKNLSKPDISMLARISNLFEVSADGLLFGKVWSKTELDVREPVYYKEEDRIIEITKKGYYEIIDEDLQVFFPVINISFSRVMGIIMELKELGYQIVDIYGNGFAIYFSTNEEAETFPQRLWSVIDQIVHNEEETTVVSYSKAVQRRISKIELEEYETVYVELFGDSDTSFYWIDQYDRVRGHGKTEEDCRRQAEEQECIHYTIWPE